MVIHPITKDDIPDIATTIGNSFCTLDPLSMKYNLKPNDYIEWVKYELSDCLKDNMCFHLDHKAFIIGKTMTTNTSNEHMFPAAVPLFNLFNYLHERLPPQIMNTLDQTLHVYMVATHQDHLGKGFALLLSQHLLQEAKKHNYKFVVAELTAPGSKHIFLNKLGFQSIFEKEDVILAFTTI
jgi:GNAT superfamily N-acetyltransferase